jgi:hypothetical protein
MMEDRKLLWRERSPDGANALIYGRRIVSQMALRLILEMGDFLPFYRFDQGDIDFISLSMGNGVRQTSSQQQ